MMGKIRSFVAEPCGHTETLGILLHEYSWTHLFVRVELIRIIKQIRCKWPLANQTQVLGINNQRVINPYHDGDESLRIMTGGGVNMTCRLFWCFFY